MGHSFPALVVAVTTCVISSVHGAAPPSPSPDAVASEFLNAHNQARATVRVGPLKWSELLAKAASQLVRYQRDKAVCRTANLDGIEFGGNQFWGGGMVGRWTPRMAVDSWVDNKKYYNYAKNSCMPNQKCGTYTQVVWRNSTELGCSQAWCIKEKSILIICFYNPPGNYIGERPY